MTVNFDDIKAAQKAIQPSVLETPLVPSFALSQLTGSDLLLKLENLQVVGSFKERGAANKIAQLTPQEREHGVIAVSAGNHAQGVARHAYLNGIKATIVMPKGTPINKVVQTQQWGAKVVIEGNQFEQSLLFARDLQHRDKLTFIHPYDDPAIIAGQGTCALEIFEKAPDLDVIVTAIGGGGLLSGTSIVARHFNPNMKIYGVQVASHDSLANFPNADKVPSGTPTIAEGIAVTKIGQLTRQIIHKNVDDVLIVSEEEIENAISILCEKGKQVAEGAGAAAFAAVMRYPHLFKNKKTAVPISGGNIDSRILSETLVRSLFRRKQLTRLVLELRDAPGTLSHITQIIQAEGGNIIDVIRHRYATTRSVKFIQFALSYEAPNAERSEMIKHKLAQKFDVIDA